jgi:fatty acid desaturase
MVPELSLRPDVLPTERLGTKGICIPELRVNLRRINSWANVWSVLSLWLVLLGGTWLVGMAACWVAWLGLFMVMGPVQARFAILAHEAAHRLLLRNKGVNDRVGKWLLAYPVLIPLGIYRRAHIAHHKEEFGADEPDLGFYGGYQCDRATLGRRLARDALGVSGVKLLVSLGKGLRGPHWRVSMGIVSTQLVLAGLLWGISGKWWAYLVVWLGPWVSVWRVLNRLRAIAEHGGLERNPDRRATSHCVEQSWLARAVFVPYNTGWHLAHHVDMGIPWRRLPAFHAELVEAGYVPEGLSYPNYRALWRSLSAA